MKAIRINEIGGPEVMQLEEIETPTPQEGEVQLMHKNQTIMGYWFTGWMSSRPDRIVVAARELMQYLATAQLEIIAEHTFSLAEAAEAHRAIAQRRTTGEVVLLV